MAVNHDVELSCDACGASESVRVEIVNEFGITARPPGWTHSGHGMAVIGAKDWCPACSPSRRGTPWAETPASVPPPGRLMAMLLLDDSTRTHSVTEQHE